MSAVPAMPPMFLSDEVFELLVRKVPAAVLELAPAALFPEAIGTSRERFEEIVTLLGADGRTQGMIGAETAGYLRRALGMALLECSPEEFRARFEVEQEDARNLMQQISARLGMLADGGRKRRLPPGMTKKAGMTTKNGWMLRTAALFLLAGVTVGQQPFAVPATDARMLRGVDFGRAQVVDPNLTSVYQACDLKEDRGGCSSDQARNTAILRFGDGTVFFDAKMAIDADGSVLSKRHERPNQPETSFRYPNPALSVPAAMAPGGPADPHATGPGPSLDAEHVPYIVMPLGDFRAETGVNLGDLAAVVKDGVVQFAIVGDLGPRTHIGEGSLGLHLQFGRKLCTSYDADGHCSTFTDTSIDPPVLYFLFPNSRRLIEDGLTPANINGRINTTGQQLWNEFLARERQAGAVEAEEAHAD